MFVETCMEVVAMSSSSGGGNDDDEFEALIRETLDQNLVFPTRKYFSDLNCKPESIEDVV